MPPLSASPVLLTGYFGPESYGIGALFGALLMGGFLYRRTSEISTLFIKTFFWNV